MAEFVHVYRLSDCMERIRNSSTPVLVVPCNQNCQANMSACVHQPHFDELRRFAIPIIAVHYRDLPGILVLHRGLSWDHALLMHKGHVIRHWRHIPSRDELETALTDLGEPQSKS